MGCIAQQAPLSAAQVGQFSYTLLRSLLPEQWRDAGMILGRIGERVKGMAKTTKTVWYKLGRVGGGHDDLQPPLETALRQLRDPFARVFQPGTGELRWVVNRFGRHRGLLTGQFLSYEAGQRQPTITLRDGVQQFDLQSIAPPAVQGARNEFLEGIAYFAISGKHVILMPSRSLGSREFEGYLNWLLNTATQVLPQDTVIAIVDQPSTKTRRKLARKQLRGVTLGTSLHPVARAETVNGENRVVYEAEGVSFDALRGLLGPGLFDRVKLSDALEADNVVVQVTIRVQGKQAISDATHDVLEQL
ncbi:MAG TPA: hypothetical protein VIZ64_08410, partial [Dokdonella sp.]